MTIFLVAQTFLILYDYFSSRRSILLNFFIKKGADESPHLKKPIKIKKAFLSFYG